LDATAVVSNIESVAGIVEFVVFKNDVVVIGASPGGDFRISRRRDFAATTTTAATAAAAVVGIAGAVVGDIYSAENAFVVVVVVIVVVVVVVVIVVVVATGDTLTQVRLDTVIVVVVVGFVSGVERAGERACRSDASLPHEHDHAHFQRRDAMLRIAVVVARRTGALSVRGRHGISADSSQPHTADDIQTRAAVRRRRRRRRRRQRRR
jgi:hypothetical protein